MSLTIQVCGKFSELSVICLYFCFLTFYRVTWPDDYFLSDLLYAPLNKLQNSKAVSIDTVTIETYLLKSQSNSGKVCADRTSCISPKQCPESSGDSYFAHVKRTKLCEDESQNDGQTTLNQVNDFGVGKVNLENSGQGQSQNNCTDGNTQSKDNDSSFTEKTDVGKQEVDDVKGHIEVITKAVGSTKPFILDIDLDFFSTKNPFKEVYTKVQQRLRFMQPSMFNFNLPPSSLPTIISMIHLFKSHI